MALTKVKTGVVDDSVFAANKNVIINGNFDIWQRGTSFTNPGNADYTADRFKFNSTGVGVGDVLQSTSVPVGTSDFSFQVDVTTVDASLSGTDLYSVRFFLEGYDTMRFGFGTSDAKNMTLSFYVRSSKTGIHCVSFRNAAVNRSYFVEYTINSADTWEFQTITLTADTSGTWLTDNGRGIIMDWILAVSPDRHGDPNIWTSDNDLATSNQVNVMDSTSNNFHLSQIQLEVGSVATAFERRSFQQELAMAQRYYEKSYDLDVFAGAIDGQGVHTFRAQTTAHTEGLSYKVAKRIAPTITLYSANSGDSGKWRDSSAGADRAVSTALVGENAARVLVTSSVDNNAMNGHFTADAEL